MTENQPTLEWGHKLLTYLTDLQAARIRRDEGFRNLQIALKQVLQNWHRLKLIRRNQGFSTTTSHLTLNAIRKNKEEDLDEYQAEIEDELSEREIATSLNTREKVMQARTQPTDGDNESVSTIEFSCADQFGIVGVGQKKFTVEGSNV